MDQISIFKIKFNYYDLERLGLFLTDTSLSLSLIVIFCILIFRTLIYWIVSLLNRNKYWKYIILLVNLIKPTRYWGIIYSEKDFSPVRYAKVKLIKFENNKDKILKKVIASTISDYFGRYAFNYKGEYKNLFLEVHAFRYKKYYKEIDTLNHITENKEIIYDAALMPKSKNLFLNKLLPLFNFVSNVFIIIFSALGLIMSIYRQLTIEQFDGFIFSAIYICVLYLTISTFFKKFTLKKLEVLESLLMHKIPGAVVRLYDRKHQLHLAVTNSKGYVLLDWVPGEHQILVTKKGYELVDDATGNRNKKMYLSHVKHVRLKKKYKQPQSLVTTPADIKIKTSLQNPFKKS